MGARLPDFVIIGAMKCGTSTLHEQLALRSGLFLSTPKEPNFFSDDAQYARGLDWYSSLFAGAREDQRCGESSTHYTKRPTYSRTVERMRLHLPHVRLVYVMRDPIERIVSHYIHEWSQHEVACDFEEALRRHERYVAYSSYAYQLEPFLECYGPESVLPVAFERLVAHPDQELARICAFLDDPSPEGVRWHDERARQNVSRERIRKNALVDLVRRIPALRAIKQRTPQSWRDRVKARWQMRERPVLSPARRAELEERLDRDLARLGTWLGLDLTCTRWRASVVARPLAWSQRRPGNAA